MSTPLPSQPASFFPTTALVRVLCSIYSRLITDLGRSSGWIRSWHCHHTMYAAIGSLESKATSVNDEPHKRSRKTYMALVARNTSNSGLARIVSWLNLKYCRKCFQLGPIFSFVRPHRFIIRLFFFSLNLLVTTCSKNAPRMVIIPNHCLHHNTSCAQQKRVRIPLLYLR